MTLNQTEQTEKKEEKLPEAVVGPDKRRLSIVWIVPLVALIIGVWLVYKTFSEKGPEAVITFKTAEGLEVGKTKVKYKDVELGKVSSINLSEDLSHVLVTVDLVKQADEFLSENTRFWVVRARVAAGGVSGLQTLFSGAYIAMDPGHSGEPARRFTGLEEPPQVTADEPGRYYELKSGTRGSLEVGSPLYYRQIRVGRVVGFQLSEDGRVVDIRVFVKAPYHKFVYQNTRFWNASGVDVKLDAKGVRVDTDSVISMMMGGISFGIPNEGDPMAQASENTVFDLYKNYDAAFQKVYRIKSRWVLYFHESVSGLGPGSPVEIHGIQIGKVIDLHMDFNIEEKRFQIPVLVEIEPERIKIPLGSDYEKNMKPVVDYLVEKGFRAQIQTSNLLTGQQIIVFDVFPDAPSASVNWDGKYPVIPTVPATLEQVGEKIIGIIKKIENLPLDEIGGDMKDAVRTVKEIVQSDDVRDSLKNLNASLGEIRKLTSNLRRNVSPQIGRTLRQVEKSMKNAETVLSSDSTLQVKTRRAMDEISSAARTLKQLADYLERHPEALLRGKGD